MSENVLNYIYEDSKYWAVNTRNAIDFELSMLATEFTSTDFKPKFSGSISIVTFHSFDSDSMKKIKSWNAKRKRNDSVFTGKMVPHTDPNHLELLLNFTSIETVDALMGFSSDLIGEVQVLKEALIKSEFLREGILVKFIDLVIET
jgi:hypothetical protein